MMFLDNFANLGCFGTFWNLFEKIWDIFEFLDVWELFGMFLGCLGMF